MVVVPAATAVTIPVAASIVATDRSDDVHAVGDAAVAVPDKLEVAPSHAVNVPVIIGNGLTLIVSLIIASQPLAFVTVTV